MKTWLITGITSGIGQQLAELLLKRGDRVAATVRKRDQVQYLVDSYGDQLQVLRLDVTDVPRVYQVIDAAFLHFGKIDVVVNNAGYGLFGAVEEVSDEQIKRQIDTNLLGSIHVVKAALPHLRAQGGGRIIQLSSMGGQIAFPGLSIYHASKWAVEGFLEAVIKEVSSFGIQITMVEPGGIQTNFSGPSMDASAPNPAYEQTPVGQMRQHLGGPGGSGDPKKVAQAIADSAALEQAPKRLVLGSDAYAMLHAELTARLADIDSQKDSASKTNA